MKKLAVITTHPIQYYAPVFKKLSLRNNLRLKVFYTWGEESVKPKYDPGFKKVIEWNIPLLDGYDYEFLKNTSANPGSGSFNGIINPEAIDKINEFQPDAILVYGWSYRSHLKIIRHFRGKIPVWFRGDSNLLDAKPGWKSAVRKMLLTWVYGHIDKAFYVGSANKEYFKCYGLRESQLEFAPHAIDNDRFAADQPDSVRRFRKTIGVSDNDFLILFAGKLEPKKNPMLLLNAFESLNKYNTHLLFIGNGILEEGLKQSVKSRDIKRVHFVDFQNQMQMPLMYQSCDVFCLPSQGPGETWGLAVNEAMASAKPIIVSDAVGCSRDLVVPQENGYIFKNNNKEQLTLSLEKLTSDKMHNRLMGNASLEIIQKWSFEEQVKMFEKEIG